MQAHVENKGTILIVEDNRPIAEMLGAFLEAEGYATDFAADGKTGLHLASTNSYDVVVLDVMLPALSGLEVCRRLRGEVKNSVPVLMLTACDTLEDKLTGLESGADDYLVKPFSVRELEARLRALIRRDRRQLPNVPITVGDMVFDPDILQVTRANQRLIVPPVGLKLLSILMRESPNVVSHRAIELEIWGDALPESDMLRTHIHNLRRIIDKPFDTPLIHTVPTVGYRIACLDDES